MRRCRILSSSARGLPVALLAMGLAALHALPPEGCPFDESLAIRLARANRAISAGEMDPGEFPAHNLGIAPEVLLQRLIADEPGEDIVVVHGDATLSNMMIDKNGNLGFVDCGNAGRGDRYVDLAVLAADIEDDRGAEAAAQFVKAYGVHAWDPAKARYYTDLYELF